jgi:hydroxymethylglutaryl-CoA synthase
MVGITSYGAYVPFWRLDRSAIGEGLRGEKAIANFDEDSVTLAVAAALDCINGVNRDEIDGLLFASTTYLYKEKMAATTIADAIDLRRNVLTVDFANSLRGGTTALSVAADMVKSGSARNVMVVAADCRLGAPGSEFERNCGDGAVALLIGNIDVAVSIDADYSVSNDMLDVWRADGDTFIRSWEEHFVINEGYHKVTGEAVEGLMTTHNLSPKDFNKAVLYAHDARSQGTLARKLGFDPAGQVQAPLIDVMGNTGAAYTLMMLVAALEKAKPGERILLANYGDGSDVFALTVTENITKIGNKRGIEKNLAHKAVLNDYKTYLHWRGLINIERGGRLMPIGNVSVPALLREREKIVPFHASKCKVCGTVQHPPQRVCTVCHTKDEYEMVRLSDNKGTLFTYAVDYVSDPVDVPFIVCVVDFEGGGRIMTQLTDKIVEEIKVGMPVEMSFRKWFYSDGIHNYFWKARPVRV